MGQYFRDKTIWITGASSGIGEAVAYRLAEEGAILIVTASDAHRIEAVAKRCKELGARETQSIPYDLSKLDGLEDLAHRAWECFDGIDILYNNAGISQRGTALETEFQVMQKVMDIDFYAPVILTRTILPKMIERGGGQVVATTSIAGRFGFPLRCAYSSAKHAMYGFFETLQAEYYTSNIRVTLVCPGRVRTNISYRALEKDGTPHGKLDAGQAKGITSQQAAKQIVKAIRHKRREVLIGRSELLMVYIKRFIPGLAAKLARNIKAT